MTYKRFLKISGLILAIISFNNCKNAPNTEGSQSATQNAVDSSTRVTEITNRPVQNYTVVPFQQVGSITPAMSETDIKQLYGDSNVVRVNRGMVQTVVFPNSDKELEIVWKKDAKFKKIGNIILRKGNWRTPEGIGLGATKKELEAINGKAVTLFPLGEDDFRVVWNDGKVHPKLALTYSKTDDRVFEMLILF
jgi:hypothetical protein